MTTRALTAELATSGAYERKPHTYFSNARTDLVARLPADATASVLEVGCGSGATGSLALSLGAPAAMSASSSSKASPRRRAKC